MRRNVLRFFLVLVTLILLSFVSGLLYAADRQYVFTSFDPPGSVLTFPIGINDSGLITIQYVDSVTVHAATMKHGTYTIIDVPNAWGTLVSAPSQQGQIALCYWGEADPYMHSAIYWRGRYSYLPDVPGQLNSSPSAINARGMISGACWNDDMNFSRGFIWDGKNYTVYDHPDSDIPQTMPMGINDWGYIVGQYKKLNGEMHSYLKYGENYREIVYPGAPNTTASGINNWGDIVGAYGDLGGGPFGLATGAKGFLLSHGKHISIEVPGALSTSPLGINDLGQIVGAYQDDQGNFHGFLATPTCKR